MNNTDLLIENFVRNFVLKDSRERSANHLRNEKKRGDFINKLNHNWASVLDMKYLFQVERQFDKPDGIQKLLGFNNAETCYLISSYPELDNQFIAFNEAFPKLYCRGLATVLTNQSGGVIFLETEHEAGRTARFIGKR